MAFGKELSLSEVERVVPSLMGLWSLRDAERLLSFSISAVWVHRKNSQELNPGKPRAKASKPPKQKIDFYGSYLVFMLGFHAADMAFEVLQAASFYIIAKYQIQRATE